MAVASCTLSRGSQGRLYLPVTPADMSSKTVRGNGLRKYFQKQFATLHNNKRNMKQQLTVDYTSTEVYAATYKSFQTFQRMYSLLKCLLFVRY